MTIWQMTTDALWDTYEVTRAEEQQFKKDSAVHPLTSRQSLKTLARQCRATATDTTERDRLQAQLKDPTQRSPHLRQYWSKSSNYVWEQLDEANAWLDAHADDLPPELYNANGKANGTQNEYASGDSYDLAVRNESEPNQFDHAIFAVADAKAHARFDAYGYEHYDGGQSYSKDTGWKPAPYKLYSRFGKTNLTYAPILEHRGEAYDKYATAKAQNCYIDQLGYDYGAVAGLRLFSEGVRIEGTELPSYARLTELLDYDGEQLTWKTSRGRAKAGDPAYTARGSRLQTRIDGVAYMTLRIIYCLANEGYDPVARGFRLINGNPADLSINNIGLEPVGEVQAQDNKWHARIRIDNVDHHLGAYPTEYEAVESCERAHHTISLKTQGHWE